MVGMEGVSFDAVISQFIAAVLRVIYCCLGVYVSLSLLEGTRVPASFSTQAHYKTLSKQNLILFH